MVITSWFVEIFTSQVLKIGATYDLAQKYTVKMINNLFILLNLLQPKVNKQMESFIALKTHTYSFFENNLLINLKLENKLDTFVRV